MTFRLPIQKWKKKKIKSQSPSLPKKFPVSQHKYHTILHVRTPGSKNYFLRGLSPTERDPLCIDPLPRTHLWYPALRINSRHIPGVISSNWCDQQIQNGVYHTRKHITIKEHNFGVHELWLSMCKNFQIDIVFVLKVFENLHWKKSNCTAFWSQCWKLL